MNKKPEILMALPCYNEAKNLRSLLLQFQELNEKFGEKFITRVLIIDDASKDETFDLWPKLKAEFQSFPLEYYRHQENLGLTGGINTAFDAFLVDMQTSHPCVAYGLMDGDNSHSPKTIPEMLRKINEGFDVVIASRFRKGSKVTGVVWWRQVLSFLLTCLFKIIRNVKGVRDYSCGYRLYSPEIVQKIKKRFPNDVVFEKSFASMVEILLRCDLEGAKCTEVPFLLRYDLKLGESKMQFKKTILGNLKLLQTLRKY